MKYCKLCDEEIQDNLMFCPECGTFLDNHPPNETFDGNTIITKNEDTQFDITKPGVYKIVNKRTGEVFVSYARNMETGINKHLFYLRTKDHDNIHIREDYNNGDRFDFIILEEFNTYDSYSLQKKAKVWIAKEDSYNYGYNRTDGRKYNPNNPSIIYSPGGRLRDKKEG